MRKLLLLTSVFLLFIYWLKDSTKSEYTDKVLQKNKKEKKAHTPKMDAPEMHALIERELRTPVDKDRPEYGPNQVMSEYDKAKSRQASFRTKAIEFTERGPGNVAGRTRALVVDPRDATQNTWIAGAATGGIWKTTDGGQTWSDKTGNLPNLGISAMAMSSSNPDVIYAGSGEGFTRSVDGFGILKSTDAGETWSFLTSEADQTLIRNVNRIIVDPNDENIALAAVENGNWELTNVSGIYKTTDGGATWSLVFQSGFRIQDLDADPSDFNIQYAGVWSSGVYKSSDAGVTWTISNSGMIPEGRVEIAVSPVNTSRIWASVVGGSSGNESDLYVSEDKGAVWRLLDELSGDNEDFLGGQGFYDNIITAHPFDANVVYVGGVNLWKFDLKAGTSTKGVVQGADFENTGSFLDFTKFNGSFLFGLDIGSADESLFSTVEVRFGSGTQFAYRFTVNQSGAGVPAEGYSYQDYVEVPFQVWDTDNNRQLMVSFRDQQEDGSWNLIESFTGADTTLHSREYLFIHGVEYSEQTDPSIAQNGSDSTGHEYNQLYFFWPVLTQGATFDPAILPVSTMRINWGDNEIGFKTTRNISDAYDDFSSNNGFEQDGRISQNGIHPDHHNLIPVIVDAASQTFKWIAANDGGVYVSNPGTTPGEPDGDWNYASLGYNTTQFYGADKAPGENRYIGGMQDNGTWITPKGVSSVAASAYEFAISGDGFEVLWNNRDESLVIGGSQFNNFVLSTNGGESFFTPSSGLLDTGDERGPFRSRLSNHKGLPDRVFAVGVSGVWKSENFGEKFKLTSIDSLWSFGNAMEVEVSIASPDVIWAGGALTNDERLFVSIDGGETFNLSNNYVGDELGFISGLGTHPTDPNTAYALFSFAGRAKVLMTSDLGITWTDISGFDNPTARAESTRGFPDVATNSILVLPNDPATIWVGTEIGIVESNDSGASWHLLDSNLPAVSVYDFKIQDSQVILATYGRGIWTYDLPDQVLVPVAPNLVNAYISPSNKFNLQVSYQNAFDSTLIYVDDEVVGSIGATDKGKTTLSSVNLGINKESSVRIESYLNGEIFETPSKETLLFETNDVSEGYANNFDTRNTTDFIGPFGSFIVNGFPSNALHSRHDYLTNDEFIYALKTPVIIQAENSTFSYRDVAIIETGEPGSVFGETDFYDYVIVEGSSDGSEWLALEDGYDSSFDPEWDSLYTNKLAATAEFFINHEIDLHTLFNPGDTVLFRFRLFADPLTVGWGWVIDDLVIQDAEFVTSVEDELLASSIESVYPNPLTFVGNVKYNFEQPTFFSMELLDLSGRTVKSYDFGTLSGSGVVQFDRKGLKSGIYLARFNSSLGSQVKRLIVN